MAVPPDVEESDEESRRGSDRGIGEISERGPKVLEVEV